MTRSVRTPRYWLTRTVAACLIGVLLQAIVAWACVLYTTPRLATGGSMAWGVPDILVLESERAAAHTELLGFAPDTWGGYYAYRAVGVRSLHTWGVLDRGEGGDAHKFDFEERSIRIGVPFSSFAYRSASVGASRPSSSGADWDRTAVIEEVEGRSLSIGSLPAWMREGPLPIARNPPPPGSYFRRVPVVPALWGTIGNTLVFACVLLPMLVLPGFVVRTRRRSRGLCPACAYDRSSLPLNAACPECGHA